MRILFISVVLGLWALWGFAWYAEHMMWHWRLPK